MSNIECVFPNKEKSEENTRAFNSIVKGMLMLEKVALARYVKKEN